MLALWIILGVLLFLLTLLLIPVTLQAGMQPIGRRGHLVLGYAFLRFDLEKWIAKPKKEKNKKPAEKKDKSGEKAKEAEPEGTADKIAQFRHTAQTVLDLIRSAAPPAAMVLRHVSVRQLQVSITVLKEDAQQTAVEYGKLCAFCGGALAVLQNVLKVKRTAVKITPDFSRDGEQEKSEVYARVMVSLLPLFALAGGLWALIRFLSRILRRSKEQAHGPEGAARPGAPKAAGPAA